MTRIVVDMCQERIASIRVVPLYLGEEAAVYYRRRAGAARTMCRRQGLWSERTVEQLFRWHDHLVGERRDAGHWPAVLAAWRGHERCAAGSVGICNAFTCVGRKGTRPTAGQPFVLMPRGRAARSAVRRACDRCDRRKRERKRENSTMYRVMHCPRGLDNGGMSTVIATGWTLPAPLLQSSWNIHSLCLFGAC